jgi:hypothetical protein
MISLNPCFIGYRVLEVPSFRGLSRFLSIHSSTVNFTLGSNIYSVAYSRLSPYTITICSYPHLREAIRVFRIYLGEIFHIAMDKRFIVFFPTTYRDQAAVVFSLENSRIYDRRPEILSARRQLDGGVCFREASHTLERILEFISMLQHISSDPSSILQQDTF